ncbi:hypothetical protein HYW76_02580 [Candidatus Pacearchaeota archaeon]|nr:hypothetical protein [Candidatus Pacearchaeota archaeon]
MQEKHIQSFNLARRELQIAEHLAHITYSIVKEDRLIPRILDKICLSLLYTINGILQYEYANKRIIMYKNSKDNLETFKKIAPKYNITSEKIRVIEEIIRTAEKHKNSPFEFSKNSKIVIMSEEGIILTLTIEKIKEYLDISKEALNQAESQILGKMD